jgi:hypothetical protein
MGRIVKYGHDGLKAVVRDEASKADLARIAKCRAAQDWIVSWLSPVEFEITRDTDAAGAVYVLRPQNWPSRDGEPQ